MNTAIILAAWVIAVIVILAFFYGRSENRKIQEDESLKWARKWNVQRTKYICDGECVWCAEKQFCKLQDGIK